jgi:hypothetical protein
MACADPCQAAAVAGAPPEWADAEALDLSRAAFVRVKTVALSPSCTVTVEQRTYAHRARRALLVTDFVVDAANCTAPEPPSLRVSAGRGADPAASGRQDFAWRRRSPAEWPAGPRHSRGDIRGASDMAIPALSGSWCSSGGCGASASSGEAPAPPCFRTGSPSDEVNVADCADVLRLGLCCATGIFSELGGPWSLPSSLAEVCASSCAASRPAPAVFAGSTLAAEKHGRRVGAAFASLAPLTGAVELSVVPGKRTVHSFPSAFATDADAPRLAHHTRGLLSYGIPIIPGA